MKLPFLIHTLLLFTLIFAIPIQPKSIQEKNPYLVCPPNHYFCKIKQIIKCGNEVRNYLKSYQPEKGKELYRSCVEVLTYNGLPHKYPIKSNIKTFGRTYFLDDDTLWFCLTNTGFEFKFTGQSTRITIAADSGSRNTYNPAKIIIYSDGVLYDKIYTKKSINSIELKFDIDKEHIVRVLKVSECNNGSLRLQGIQTDSGTFEPTPDSDKKIEFIGDSIVCGYGVDSTNPGSSFTTKTEDGTKAYAFKVAQKFNVDFSMVSYSGYGVLSGFSNNGIKMVNSTLPLYYDKIGSDIDYTFNADQYNISLKDISWDANEFIPDLIVINLGTNDATYISSIPDENLQREEKKSFITEYKKFLYQIRSIHPKAQILCTLGILGNELFPQIVEAVNNYVSETKDDKVQTFEFNVHNVNKNGAGASYHPSALSHIDAAYELIYEIESVYQWTSDPNITINN